MKTTHCLQTTEGLARFVPVEGTWQADFDSETQSCWDAVPVLEHEIEKVVGCPVVVQIFHANGHAITDNSNECRSGSMLVTKATSTDLRNRT